MSRAEPSELMEAVVLGKDWQNIYVRLAKLPCSESAVTLTGELLMIQTNKQE